MDIQNFTGQTVRLGDFPQCVDVTNIPNNHSSNGLMCRVFNFAYPNTSGKDLPPRIMLIKNNKDDKIMHLLVLRWDEQFDSLDSEIKNGEIVFDSKQKETK